MGTLVFGEKTLHAQKTGANLNHQLRIIDARGERKICREHRCAYASKCPKCENAVTVRRFDMQRWYERQWGAEARKAAR